MPICSVVNVDWCDLYFRLQKGMILCSRVKVVLYIMFQKFLQIVDHFSVLTELSVKS